MPAYVSSPFPPRAIGLLPGIPGYSFGSFNDRTPPTKLLVNNVALTTNVATVTVQIVDGLVPVAASLITIQGCRNSTFNVTNVAITSLSISAVTGAGTIVFPLTHANITSVADAGVALVPQPEVGDALTGSAQSGQQFAMQAESGLASNSRDIGWEITTPSAPSTFTANLQVALFDQDAQYSTVDTTTATGARTITGQRANFVRIQISASTGGSSPTIIGKILV